MALESWASNHFFLRGDAVALHVAHDGHEWVVLKNGAGVDLAVFFPEPGKTEQLKALAAAFNRLSDRPANPDLAQHDEPEPAPVTLSLIEGNRA